jgi:uncharacterized protein YbjT (DUF2867 family)
VYLGGIVHDDDLSPHLASRREVGEILRTSGVPTIEFRTSIVVGAGSASFELVCDLVDALPLLVGARLARQPGSADRRRRRRRVSRGCTRRAVEEKPSTRPLALRDAVAVALG